MNQQRGRRFRSAREAEDVVRKALQKGLVLPTEPRFVGLCVGNSVVHVQRELLLGEEILVFW